MNRPRRSHLGAGQRSSSPRRSSRAQASWASSTSSCSAPPTIPPTTWLAIGRFAASGLQTRVLPAFRPDKALQRASAGRLQCLGRSAWTRPATSRSAACTLSWMHWRSATTSFHSMGARLSDHGLDRCSGRLLLGARPRPRSSISARDGQPRPPEEHEQFASYMMLFFGRLDAEKGWTKQLHLGAFRNANTRRFREIGPEHRLRLHRRLRRRSMRWARTSTAWTPKTPCPR